MSILVKNITKVYGTQKALDDVSFETGKGKVLGFLGPNGAGKSTMMKIITCYLPQTSGSVTVCGFDVNEEPIEVKKKVGYLPEHNPLYLDMYVSEYLEFIGGMHGLKATLDARVKEMIAITGLEKERKKKIGALSKGYRQRVGLAQALIHDPEILILDEPTSGLDPNQLAEIRELIKVVGQEKTVILSTHVMQEVEAICSRVIIINNGKIAADETTELLRKKSFPSTLVVVEFDTPVTEAQMLSIEGVQSAVAESDKKWKVKPVAGKDIRTAVFNFAVANKLAVLGMQEQEQKLEEIFRQLTVS